MATNRPFSWANPLKEPKRSYRFSINFPYYSPTVHAQQNGKAGAYTLAKYLSKSRGGHNKWLDYHETNFAIMEMTKAEYSYDLETDTLHGVNIYSSRIAGEEKFTPLSMKLVVSKGADLEWSMNFLTYFRGPGKAYHDTWGLESTMLASERTVKDPCKGKNGVELARCRKKQRQGTQGFEIGGDLSRTNSSLMLRAENFKQTQQLIVYEWAGGSLAKPSDQQETYTWEPNRGGAYQFFSAPWIARYIIKNPVITSWKISPYSYSSDDFVTLEAIVQPGAGGYVEYEVNGEGNTNDVMRVPLSDSPEVAASYASYSDHEVRNSIGDVRKFIAQDSHLPNPGRSPRRIAMGSGPGRGPAWMAIHGSADKDPPVLAEPSTEYQSGVNNLTSERRAKRERAEEQGRLRREGANVGAEWEKDQGDPDSGLMSREAARRQGEARRRGADVGAEWEQERAAQQRQQDRANSPEWKAAQAEFEKGQRSQETARLFGATAGPGTMDPGPAPAKAPSGDLFDSLSNTGQRRVDQPGGAPGRESSGAQWSGQITPEQRADMRRDAEATRRQRETDAFIRRQREQRAAAQREPS